MKTARRQAKDARACDRLLADLIRFHGGQGRKPHAVNRRPIGTPDRHPIGTPSSYVSGD
jgi:hypothetical protein